MNCFHPLTDALVLCFKVLPVFHRLPGKTPGVSIK